MTPSVFSTNIFWKRKLPPAKRWMRSKPAWRRKSTRRLSSRRPPQNPRLKNCSRTFTQNKESSEQRIVFHKTTTLSLSRLCALEEELYMAKITMREAISQALMEEMDRDPAVFIIGEEVGVWGGTYAVTKGFYDKYGPDRIKDTPIAENAIIGAAIGAAMVGQRPIA